MVVVVVVVVGGVCQLGGENGKVFSCWEGRPLSPSRENSACIYIYIYIYICLSIIIKHYIIMNFEDLRDSG